MEKNKFNIIEAAQKAAQDANELAKTNPAEAKRQYEADRWVLEQSGWSEQQLAAYFGQTIEKK